MFPGGAEHILLAVIIDINRLLIPPGPPYTSESFTLLVSPHLIKDEKFGMLYIWV